MNYYPPELTDWWMDDWISLVYGKTRTFKARNASVIHHTGLFERYVCDFYDSIIYCCVLRVLCVF